MRWLREFGFFLLMVFGTKLGHSQSNLNKIDSLDFLFSKEQNDSVQYELLSNIAVQLANDNKVVKGLVKMRQANKFAYKMADTARIVRSQRRIAQMFWLLAKHDSAERIFLKILPVALRNNFREDCGIILNYLGIIYTFQSRFDKALANHFKGLEYRNDSTLLSISLHNIGLVYYKLLNYSKAVQYFEQALKVKKRSNDFFELDGLLINICLCYAYTDKFEQAGFYLNESLKACNENCTIRIEMERQFARAIIELREGNGQRAKAFFLLSYNMSRQIEERRFELENLVYLSEICVAQGGFKSAERYLGLAQKVARNKMYNSLQLGIYRQFSSLYNHTNDSRKEVQCQTKYIQLRDSIYNDQLTQDLMVIQAEQEQLGNKARIDSQSGLLLVKQDVIDRQEKIKLLTYIAAFLLLLLIVLLLTYDLIRKREMVMLERKVKVRTRELEDTYEVIQKYYSEHTHHLKTTADTIKNCVSTINGLHFLLSNEMAGKNVPEYMQKVEEAATGLSRVFTGRVES